MKWSLIFNASPGGAEHDVASAPERAIATGPRWTAADRVSVHDTSPSARLRRMAGMAPLQVLREFDSSLRGLEEREAQARLDMPGENLPETISQPGLAAALGWALLDPFVMVLLFLGAVSALTGDLPAVLVITVLAAVSCGLRVGQEHRAAKAAAALRVVTANTTTVVRRARARVAPLAREVPTDQLVPGDVVRLAAGDAISADLRLLRSTGLTVSQALLTGESLPVSKHAKLAGVDNSQTETHDSGAPFDDSRLCLMGATVVSGTGTAVVVATGAQTYLSASHQRMPHRRGRTTFDRDVRAISWTLITLMAATVPVVLALTEFSRDSWLQACLFAIAVAVGLIPEMLPVVVTTALIRSHAILRRRRVVVRQLPAIYNMGAMDVLCIDKTGTLTLGRLTVACHLDPVGRYDSMPLRFAYLNARFGLELGDPPVVDAIDEALLRDFDANDTGEAQYTGLHTLPFDPTRRRASVVLRPAGSLARQLVVTKGAVEAVLDCCSHARVGGRDEPLTRGHRRRLRRLSDQLHAEGVRVLAVAVGSRPADARPLRPPDESGLTLLGYVGLNDESKPAAKPALAELTARGVQVKVLTGDHPLAAARICRDAGIDPGRPVSGFQINDLDDDQLVALARTTTLFARVDAQQKARIVTAIRAAGHAVGYVGDGVNDATALHAAEVAGCVQGAVDVAQRASDVLLAEKDLAALTDAVTAGRHAHANVIKYVKITLSSTLGNVCAVLAASATLPFVPMLPLQILVQNLLFDISQLSLAYDRTDPDAQAKPRGFHARDLTKFVLCFGVINALADLATFMALRHILPNELSSAGQALFHTGWFVENLLTQVLAVHMLRSRNGLKGWTWAARPVLLASAGVVLLSLGLPFSPIGHVLGLRPMPTSFYLWLAPILATYTIALLAGKRLYQRIFGVWI
jgi:Mg2+-importing ATPase